MDINYFGSKVYEYYQLEHTISKRNIIINYVSINILYNIVFLHEGL